jgi:hypothetical protein
MSFIKKSSDIIIDLRNKNKDIISYEDSSIINKVLVDFFNSKRMLLQSKTNEDWLRHYYKQDEVNSLVPLIQKDVSTLIFILLFDKPEEDIQLLSLFSIINQYPLFHIDMLPGIKELYNYFFAIPDIPLSHSFLFKNGGIKKYTTPDIIPLQHYYTIKKYLLKDGIKISDYHSHHFFVYFIFGEIISIFISDPINPLPFVYTFILHSIENKVGSEKYNQNIKIISDLIQA